jgi:hypothetical protein
MGLAGPAAVRDGEAYDSTTPCSANEHRKFSLEVGYIAWTLERARLEAEAGASEVRLRQTLSSLLRLSYESSASRIVLSSVLFENGFSSKIMLGSSMPCSPRRSSVYPDI